MEDKRGLVEAFIGDGHPLLTFIGIHFIVGYTDFIHLYPAFMGLTVLLIGLYLTYEPMTKRYSAQVL